MGPAKRTCIAVAASCLLAAAGLPSQAGETYYRWVDTDGTPMNSDHPPPPGIEYETITVGSGLYRRPGGDAAAATPAAAAERPEAPQAQAEAGQQAGTKDPQACQVARQNLETLNTRARIRMPDGEGGYHFLTEEEKEAQREQAAAVIKRACE
ncbi:MAG: DUF4124 domain-containing protein [Pseudomonadales bacterium]|nr:DUF4124 domain-containing protein [Halieaceae bacterium]MCP5189059.1 DUF4124 domain-containing protein [Pseudomonadales bacterium]